VKKALLITLGIVICIVAGAVYAGHAVYRAIASGAFCVNCVQFNNGGPTIAGSGHLVTQKRTVAPFTAIRADTAIEVVIDRTGTPSLSVTADDNLVSFFTAEVRDGTLYLAVAPGRSFQTKKAVYYVTVADLRAIESRGSGEIEARHLDSPALTVTVTGSGDVKLAGRADDFTLTVRGSGDVDAAGLRKARKGRDERLGRRERQCRRHPRHPDARLRRSRVPRLAEGHEGRSRIRLGLAQIAAAARMAGTAGQSRSERSAPGGAGRRARRHFSADMEHRCKGRWTCKNLSSRGAGRFRCGG
jgi:hypothetical protein